MKNNGNALSFRKIRSCYDEAIKIFPEYIAVYTNKGSALFGLNDFTAVVKCYNEALNLRFNREIENLPLVISTTYLHRGLANYNQGYLTKALDDFSKIYDSETSPELKARKYLNMGLCYHKMNLFDKALNSTSKSFHLTKNRLLTMIC